MRPTKQPEMLLRPVLERSTNASPVSLGQSQLEVAFCPLLLCGSCKCCRLYALSITQIYIAQLEAAPSHGIWETVRCNQILRTCLPLADTVQARWDFKQKMNGHNLWKKGTNENHRSLKSYPYLVRKHLSYTCRPAVRTSNEKRK